MPLPSVKCPVCHCIMSLDVLFADDAPREALLAIINVHPQGDKFIKPLLHYVGLFAPSKSQMSHNRIAALINELTPMIEAGRIERNGTIHIAPFEFWVDALNVVLAARNAGTLTTPLKSHGYLLEVIAKRANATAAKQEQLQHESAKKGEARRSELRDVQIQTNVCIEQSTHSHQTPDSEARKRLADLRSGIAKKQSGQFSMSELVGDLKPS